MDTVLRDVFGLSSFRPGQREVIDAVLAGRPSVVVMPTGAGKSLLYQLPAVVAGGTTLVVSPLIALMKDQVDVLAARGVSVCAITSQLGDRELSDRLADVAAGRIRLVYVAPERFRSPRFVNALDAIAKRISLFAIDEAHCISEWGHDFRPDYMRLGDVMRRWKPPRVVALTATATPEVRRDIVRQLEFVEPALFVRGFDRPNLRLTVERTGGATAKETRILALVRAQRPALVYAATRNNAESYAEALVAGGVRAAAYHAGLDDDLRSRTQERFIGGDSEVVVATNAFGMGVDKADVRLVVHADLPRSPEAYYQEAGRAGRDGAGADCVLLFNHADVKLQEFLIEAGTPSVDLLRAVWRAIRTDPRCGSHTGALKRALPSGTGEAVLGAATRYLLKAGYLRNSDGDGGLEAVHPSDGGAAPVKIDAQALAARASVERAKLKSMVEYAYAATCRRRYLLGYFGDEDAKLITHCAGCDVCSGAGARGLTDDEKAQVGHALRLVEKLRGRFGRGRVAALLIGDDDDPRFDDLAERGALRKLGSAFVRDLLRALEVAGLLEVSAGEYPLVKITRAGQRVADGREDVELIMPQGKAAKKRKPSAAAAAGPISSALVDKLRAWRLETARKTGVPAYVVFSDKTLDAIAGARPADLAALAAVDGIGPARLERYGQDILTVLRA